MSDAEITTLRRDFEAQTSDRSYDLSVPTEEGEAHPEDWRDLSGRYVRTLLAHWHDPAVAEQAYVEDFRDAHPSQDWQDPYYGLTHDPQGGPTVVDSIGAQEDPAVDFDGSDDYIDVDLDPIWDLPSDEGRSFLVLFNGQLNTDAGAFIEGTTSPFPNREGFSLYNRADFDTAQLAFDVDDGDGNKNRAKPIVEITDTHLGAGIWDPDGDQIISRVEGVLDQDTSSPLVTPSVSTPILEIGAQKGQSRFQDGKIGFVAAHPEVTSPGQEAYIDDILKGSVPQATLPVIRDQNGNLKRDLPEYLTDAFGEEGPLYWWTSKRHFFSEDQESIEQLPDHSGENVLIQREGSRQGIAVGGDRGEAIDHISCSNASTRYPVATPADTSQDQITVAIYSGLHSRDWIWGIGGSGFVELKDISSGRVSLEWEDKNGNYNRFILSDSLSTGFSFGEGVLVGTIDFSAGEARFIATDSNGNYDEASSSSIGVTAGVEVTSHYLNARYNGSGESDGQFREFLVEPTYLTPTEQDALHDALVDRFI